MLNTFFDDYPELDELFKVMREKRCLEIFDYLKSKDKSYTDLIKAKSEQSMVLRNDYVTKVSEFDKYMDLIHEQENYELDAIYYYAFCDAIIILKNIRTLL